MNEENKTYWDDWCDDDEKTIVTKIDGKFHLKSFTGKYVKDKEGKHYPVFEGTYWEDWGVIYDNFKEVTDGE